MQTKPTPTPWVLDLTNEDDVFEPCFRIYRKTQTATGSIENAVCYVRASNPADAAFIVRAANNFADLLNALKLAQTAVDAQRGCSRLGIILATVIARAEGLL